MPYVRSITCPVYTGNDNITFVTLVVTFQNGTSIAVALTKNQLDNILETYDNEITTNYGGQETTFYFDYYILGDNRVRIICCDHTIPENWWVYTGGG